MKPTSLLVLLAIALALVSFGCASPRQVSAPAISSRVEPLDRPHCERGYRPALVDTYSDEPYTLPKTHARLAKLPLFGSTVLNGANPATGTYTSCGATSADIQVNGL